ncbi:TnsA-like heteromeric transposase endonuclease subunit [Kocuria sp.]|uniref:TnsA-like heteromeric transposase endonuclease subunit n=1 Tax=Kocuria sp. TaxID=1871328 RepID=UPI0026DEFC7E|nr:TnsA-like heteromeric transposase endonuclease subunit [Kocuria sp.]MDO5619655.1 TnsA-like heteromeric transposase endonuclease subunit [Kocuria sp.]
MAVKQRTLPANVTDTTLVLWSSEDAGWQSQPIDASMSNVRLDDARPAREFAAWPGKRNYEGLWWSSTTRSHVGFESLLERDALLWFDWDADVVGVSSQPVAFLWPKGTPGHKSHVPDYFVRLANGDGKIVDVRSPSGQTEKALAQFSLTRAACETAGWQYEVWGGLPDDVAPALRWLSGYRQDRCAPSPETRDRLIAAFRTGIPLSKGVEQVARFAPVSAELIIANVYHLLWTHTLTTDLTLPLSLNTQVVAA